jgi:hypothetical protein
MKGRRPMSAELITPASSGTGQIMRPPRDGDRTWGSYRTDVDGAAAGYWIVYSAEKGAWETKA